MATGRRPGALFSNGTTSLSQTVGQRIAPSAAARRFLLRRQSRILFDAIGGGGAEPGFGRGNGRRLGLAETHVQPHLAVGDVAAGQAAVPHRREEPASYPAGRDRQKTRPLAGPRRSPDSQLQSGYALPSSRIRRHFLILIDALFSSCLPRSSRGLGHISPELEATIEYRTGQIEAGVEVVQLFDSWLTV